MPPLLELLQWSEHLLWTYLCLPALIGLGLFLGWKSRLAQLRHFPKALGHFLSFFSSKKSQEGGITHEGVAPIKAFFACVGGCIGIGNIVGVCTAVQIGGPGALFWLWMTAAIGMLVKYAEVYLGMRYRVTMEDGSWRGGPMYFLAPLFKSSWVPMAAALLLCIYGVEIYQFTIVASSLSTNFSLDKGLVVLVLLLLVLYAGRGGVARVGAISSAIIPLFILIYLGMVGWILLQHWQELPTLLWGVLASAFTGHAATGGFVGSTMMLALSQGLRRACYSGDLAIGYASVIHSESREPIAEKQASLVMVDIFLDSFIICTATILLVLATGVWQEPIDQELLVQSALEQSFSYASYFMPLFLFFLGYSTINAYFVVGLNCAEFLGGALGRKVYYGYSCLALLLFAYVDSTVAQSVMTLVGGGLLLLNCYGIARLSSQLSFAIPSRAEGGRQKRAEGAAVEA